MSSWKTIVLVSSLRGVTSLVWLMILTLLGQSAFAETEYSDRATFESVLGVFLVDDYEALAYQTGDVQDDLDLDVHTDASMNAVLSETRYTSTGFSDTNLIVDRSGDHHYCAGCNGSYELDFTATSVGTGSGVFGVGLDVEGTQSVFGTTAFVTFGDGSTNNFSIPEVDAFWGITSSELIASIHFGLPDGGVNTDGSVQRMAMDDLTIGSVVPEPSSVTCLLAMLVTASVAVRWRG